MSRVQLALNVSDLEASVDFYSRLFATSRTSAARATRTSPSPSRRLKLVLIEVPADRARDGHAQAPSITSGSRSRRVEQVERPGRSPARRGPGGVRREGHDLLLRTPGQGVGARPGRCTVGDLHRQGRRSGEPAAGDARRLPLLAARAKRCRLLHAGVDPLPAPTTARATIRVYEPALCCNTGVCGPDVDEAWSTFTADLGALKDSASTSSGTTSPTTRRPSRGRDGARVPAGRRLRRTAADHRRRRHRHDGPYPTRDQLLKFAGVEHRRSCPGGHHVCSTCPRTRLVLRRNDLLLTMMRFLDDPPRFLFFTGKGGVGKTSVACATAVTLAEQGQHVLLVSTDPASNVGQVLGVTIGNTITRSPTCPACPLWRSTRSRQLTPTASASSARSAACCRTKEIASITEQLSGSCTTEVASFNEFTALLADEKIFGQYDHVLFDTAPTGHTIRLLQLPGSWTDFLNEGKGDASCLGPLAGLDKQRAVYAEAVAALKDPDPHPAGPRRPRAGLGHRRGRRAPTTSSPRSASAPPTSSSTGCCPRPRARRISLAAVRGREAAALAAMPAALAHASVDVIELKAVEHDRPARPPPPARRRRPRRRRTRASRLRQSTAPGHRLGALVDEIEAGRPRPGDVHGQGRRRQDHDRRRDRGRPRPPWPSRST